MQGGAPSSTPATSSFSRILNPTDSNVPRSNPVDIPPPNHPASLNPAMAAATMGLPPHAAAGHPQSESDQRDSLPRPYKCPLCDKAFHRLEHQTRHIRTHTGEKPHACQNPGCTKRFSRSDELTRHSRIHTNPNSRRSKQQNSQAAAATAMMINGTLPEGQAIAHVMGPPPYGSFSNPGSATASPNISPPHGFSHHPGPYSTSYNSYNTNHQSGSNGSPDGSYTYQQQTAPNMNMLAHAASQAARENEISSYSSIPARNPAITSYSSYPYPRPNQMNERQSGGVRLPGLAQYHFSSQPSSQPMSRSHSHEEDDQNGNRITKRSRPESPFSTNPPSPTFSQTSYSPTPGHTPAITPGHSPRIGARSKSDVHLPHLRSLSIQHMHSPALEPLEPLTEASGGQISQGHTPYSRSQNTSSTGLRIADIISREDGTQRKLPVPTPPGNDQNQCLPSFNQGDWMDRS